MYTQGFEEYGRPGGVLVSSPSLLRVSLLSPYIRRTRLKPKGKDLPGRLRPSRILGAPLSLKGPSVRFHVLADTAPRAERPHLPSITTMILMVPSRST